MRVEEKRKARRKRVDVHAGGHRRFDVREAVGEREREFLHGGRAGFANVIARDRDRVPLGHLGRAELHHVDDDAHVRPRRKDPLFLRDVFFEDVGLQRAAERGARHALVLGGGDVLRERDRGRTVDRHRRRDRAHVDAVEERLHVAQRVDRDAALADFAAAPAAHRSRSPSASACRTRPKAPSGLARARSDSARWFAARCRSRRTGASSRAGRDTCSDGCRACTDIRRVRRDRARRRARRRRSGRRPL